MSTLRELQLRTDYRTQNSSPTDHFYVPCLTNSVQYLRAAGYFRSSILALVGPAYIDFACRGGKATLVCSPDLDPDDVSAISAGEAHLEARIISSLVRDVETLLASKELQSPVAILATLIAQGALRVLIAYRPDAAGIYHEKIGCFADGFDNCVSFVGSANETYSAWAERGNFESIEVFCSWDSDKDRERTLRHRAYLTDLAEDRIDGLRVINFPEAAAKRLFERAFDSLNAIRPTQKQAIIGRVALPHQAVAIQAWKDAGYRGVLQHATGSGKTFTAIMAIAEHASLGLPSIVLVPSTLLQAQWKREIAAELPKAAILLAGGGHSRWRERMALEAQTSLMDFPDPRITIAVMATASSPEFVAKVEGGEHLLVVADEVHQIGSTEFSKSLRIEAGKRLGLSATPHRYGDPEGTERIFRYFGDVVKPIISLKDAITAGRLVNYQYHPVGVRLNEEESREWRALTKRIGYLIGQQASAKGESGEDLQRLLIRRARIAKRASAKAPIAAKILSSHFSQGQRWLVYCEDVEHMEKVASELRAKGITPTLYHSAMDGEKERTLQWFSDTGGVVLAVRCLDEGIDIPSVTHALILASSQNPRQFVQRRGRILRKAPGKHIAVLHDVLVLPVDDEDDPLGSLESEFTRAIEFANDAINQSAHAVLLSMAAENGMDISSHYPEIQGEAE